MGGVVYGAVRGRQRIGDVVLDRATRFGTSIERDIDEMLARPAHEVSRASDALDRLRRVASTTRNPHTKQELDDIVSELRNAFLDDQSGRVSSAIAGTLGTSRPLAPREVEALQLVAVGLSNREIASAMGLSTETVRAYLRSAMRRLNVHNRTAAVHVATRQGLINRQSPE